VKSRDKALAGKKKQLSNPFSTGGGGNHFEAHVQASFVALMLTNGFAPTLPCWPILKIKLQGKADGYDTDDMIVFVEKIGGDQRRKLLAQIKHAVPITSTNKVFGEVIHAAWSDFNNPKLFTEGSDAIALITGPLSNTDISGARGILEWARHTNSAEEFLRMVDMSNLSSDDKRSKLKAFREQLKKANGGVEVPDDRLFQFLRHFHLLSYDLDIKAGVHLSLMHSLMSQYTTGGAQMLWSRIVDEVQSWNKNAGALSRDNIAEDLRDAFKAIGPSTIPLELRIEEIAEEISWNQVPHAAELALANMVGSWNEKSLGDRETVSEFVQEDFQTWILKMRELLQHPETSLKLKDGEWSIGRRRQLWNALGTRLFDSTLDLFKKIVVKTLGEIDPKFELPAEERSAAQIHGKVPAHSSSLRRGLAEGLALLGCSGEVAVNCTEGKAQTISVLTVREILSNADWLLWGSLNDLLPQLAEAAPDEFLRIVEESLESSICPFDELFRQETSGISGQNYLTGLLWALEGLAWDERYLVRVCVLLSNLAARDPGGHWGNRPFNSLVTILLPWLPQTTASLEKRRVAVKTMQQEEPSIAWKLLIALLPGMQQSSMGSHKPAFLPVELPDEKERRITKKDYQEQVLGYASDMLSMAEDSVARIIELVRHAERLSPAYLEQLLKILTPAKILQATDSEKLELWRELSKIISKVRSSSNNRGMSLETVAVMEGIADEVAPKDPAKLHRRLFSHVPDELRNDGTSFEERSKTLELKRQKAVGEILTYGGITGVIDFAKAVDVPGSVGFSLALITESDIDAEILPSLLGDSSLLQFAHGYVRGRFHKDGAEWIGGVQHASWQKSDVGQFLALLPFTPNTWNIAKEWLGEHDSEYWVRVNPNIYETNEDLGPAVDKLIENGRTRLAIACLAKPLNNNGQLDIERSIKVLLSPTTMTEEGEHPDVYDILEIIKVLQASPDVDQETLFRVEWKYLQLLDRDDGASAKVLEDRLASNPAFFTELVEFLYHPRSKPREEKTPTPQEESIARNVWRLLHGWKTPPGMKSDDTFSESAFQEWVSEVTRLCTESDRLEVAMLHLGCVLFYAPPDPDGLWIHRSVAAFLNGKDAEKSRQGFSQQVTNSRGVHWIDPTGTPERELAKTYRDQAESIENAGFQRFAATLRAIADQYDREADHIINNPLDSW